MTFARTPERGAETPAGNLEETEPQVLAGGRAPKAGATGPRTCWVLQKPWGCPGAGGAAHGEDRNHEHEPRGKSSLPVRLVTHQLDWTGRRRRSCDPSWRGHSVSVDAELANWQ